MQFPLSTMSVLESSLGKILHSKVSQPACVYRIGMLAKVQHFVLYDGKVQNVWLVVIADATSPKNDLAKPSRRLQGSTSQRCETVALIVLGSV